MQPQRYQNCVKETLFVVDTKIFYKNIIRISLENNCIGDDDLNTIGKDRYVVINKVSYHR